MVQNQVADFFLFVFDILSASIIFMVLMLLRWCEVFPLGNKGEVVQMLKKQKSNRAAEKTAIPCFG